MFGKSSTVFFALAAAALSVSALSIDTPEKLTECGTVALSWHGKNAPFTLHVLPSCESESEDSLLVLPPMNATTYNWAVNLPSKTSAIAFAIVDAEGNEAYTDEIDVGKSGSAACLNASSSSSSAASTSTGSPATTSAVATPTTLVVSATSTTTGTPYVPVNAGSGSSGSSVNTDNSNTNTSDANGAITNTASILVGAIGVIASLFNML